MRQSCLQLQGVWKRVNLDASPLDILLDVTLEIDRGEFVAVMGASGSGKSTLLNLMGLLDVPSQGRLALMGQDVAALQEDALARLRAQSIGFIFQSFNLIPYLSARDNIRLGQFYSQVQGGDDRADELLSRMNLSHRADALPNTLSGGERQRVAIARALANRPPLLLADEPTGALDSKNGQEILALLKSLHREGTTIVLVTHDDQIGRQAQRTLRMKDGRLL